MDTAMIQKHISIKVIEDNDLCISCGACTHICPFDNILMKYVNQRGKYDAVVTIEETCLQCNGEKNCLAVCPSYNTNYDTLANASANNFLGNIENVYNGYSKDEEMRQTSSSGGFIRALVTELLATNKIDGVITITHDEGLNYTPKIIQDIKEMPNSIYHNINYENAITLLKEHEGTFLLLGLPCQITSIEKLLLKKKFRPLQEKIYAKVALICGYTFERTNMEFFAHANRFDLNTISYREHGRYRKTRITNNKTSILFDVYNPVSIKERVNNSIMFDKFMPQKHCLYCVDHMGYCADIVVGDAWQSRYSTDKVGTNLIIARTEGGDKIISSLKSFSLDEGFKDEIEASQHQYAKPNLGLSFAEYNLFRDNFVVEHVVSKESTPLMLIPISFKNRAKVVFLKSLLRKRAYRTLQMMYISLEWKTFIKLLVKRILGKKI